MTLNMQYGHHWRLGEGRRGDEHYLSLGLIIQLHVHVNVGRSGNGGINICGIQLGMGCNRRGFGRPQNRDGRRKLHYELACNPYCRETVQKAAVGVAHRSAG